MSGNPFRPISLHFLSKKNREGPVYSFKRKEFFFKISIMWPNSTLFLTPVCGKITYPLKLQYWQPIWNSFELTYMTCISGFFLLINSTVFGIYETEGMVADANMVNLGG